MQTLFNLIQLKLAAKVITSIIFPVTVLRDLGPPGNKS